MELNKIYQGDSLDVLKTFPDQSINCCITSPPYFGLRDYGMADQIGLEETPELFIEKLVKVFREVKRVLKDDGTLWVNIGDSYANKNLIGIPWMLAFALRSDGWYLRQDIIWSKPNPMPESVTDRCTKAHEYIFLLSKSKQYYYDHEAIKQPVTDATVQRMLQQIEDQKGSDRVPGKTNGNMKAVGPGRTPRTNIDNKGGNQASGIGIPAMAINGNGVKGYSGYFSADGELIGGGMANKKSVWTVTTKPFSEAHFATYPEDLIVDCIKAGCPVGGTVLDTFGGAGTTALVCKKHHRNYVLIELNPEYIGISERRIRNTQTKLF